MISLKRKISRLILISIGLVLSLILLFLGWQYWQSSNLKGQADKLIAEGRPDEAIVVYDKAHKIFPLRQDVVENLEGARLVLQSELAYGQIYEIGSEFQEEPSFSQLPTVIQLKSNEFFVPILMYHHIRINPKPQDAVWAALNVTPAQLEEQVAYLKAHNFHTITLSELLRGMNGDIFLPDNAIVLSFDDGYRNFYENAFPILKKYNMKAVQFVITGVVGSQPYLTWEQIAEMDKSGLVEFGAHTRHHPNLPDLGRMTIEDEIKGSKIDLESHLKKTVIWFAYPYGSYNDFIVQTTRNAGFAGAVSTIYGGIQSKEKLYLLPRIMVDGRFSLDNIARRIQK